MFKKILYVIGIAIFIFIAVGLFLPRQVHVERSSLVQRPVSTVYVLLNGFRTWAQWSPWAARDPAIQVRFHGPESGVGAGMSWSGDPRLVGDGMQEVIEVTDNRLVRVRMEVSQQGLAESTFRMEPVPEGTRLTWAFDSDLAEGQGFFGGLLARYFGLFFDQWIGSDFEQGLANFSQFAESLPATDFSSLDVELVMVQPLDILYVPASSPQAPGDIALSLANAYSEIGRFMADNEVAMIAQPMAITRGWDEEGYSFDAAIPVEIPEGHEWPLGEGMVRLGESPAGQAVRVIHRGSYAEMAPSYEKLAAYMAVHGLVEGNVSWEHYISDPGDTAEQDLVTHIYFLVASDD